MKLKFENLGVIKSGEIDLSKELIILTGRNNTGKSYVSYLLYGLYRQWDDKERNKFYEYLIEKSDIKYNYPEFNGSININKNIKEITEKLINSLENNLNKSLHSLFASKQIKPNISIFSTNIDYEIKKVTKLIKKYKNVTFLSDKINYKNYVINDNINQKLALDVSKKEYASFLTKIIFDLLDYYGNISINLYNKFFPAERSSINLFSKDIIQNKAKKLDELSLLSEEERKKIRLKVNFPLPINDYLYFINNLKDRNSYESDYTHIAETIEKMIGGTVDLNEFDEMVFKPGNSKKQLDLHISSSTVKSLAGIIFYFRYYAMKNDIIFIDEPELNLHPDNQIKLTHILAKAVNSGIKIVISTHSDYIIKEFNNLIMLNSDKTGKITKELNYDKNWVLDKNKVGAYYFPFGNNTVIKELEVSKTGISVESIDNTIDEQDYNSETIYYNLFES